MQLLKAHIIDFGKFHEIDFDFTKGLNNFQHENGWGKTTLSVFIKSMLYGMEHSTSKDITKNEKLKYAPWKGGIYGGSLNFDHNQKEYQIKRTFSLKKNEDTFELIDLKTNKKSTDFSSDLGTELFGINRETYGRSVHVTLAETPAGSTDISAKLNNLVEAGDVSNFDKAIEVLEKKATNLKAKRGKNDKISAIQDKIDSDRNYIDDINAKIKQNAEYLELITKINSTINALKEKQNAITEELSKSAKYESKIRYEQLKSDIKKDENLKNQLLEFFNGEIPSAETVKNIDAISSNLTTIESNIENLSASQSEKNTYESLREYFAGDIPTKEQINECLKLDSEYKDYRQKETSLKLSEQEEAEFNLLKTKYENAGITEDLITQKINDVEKNQNGQKQLNELQSEFNSKKNELTLAQAIKPKNTKKLIFLIISALLGIGGIVFILLHNIIPGIVCFGLSAVFLVTGILFKTKKIDNSALQNEVESLQNQLEKLQNELKNTENEIKEFIFKYNSEYSSELIALSNIKTEFNNYSRLEKKYSEYEKWISLQENTPQNYEDKIRMFAKRYCKTENISTISSDIQILNEKLAKLEALEKKIDADSENQKAQAEEKEKLSAILNQYKTDKTLDYKEQVLQIHNKITEIKNAQIHLADSEEALKNFENDPDNDIESFKNLTKPEKSVDELQNELSKLTEEISINNKTVSGYQKIIDDNSADTDKKEDIETEIERLSLEKEEALEENKLLIKTSDLLKLAKEKLDANYSDPMKEGFEKYIKMVSGDEESLKLLINTDLEVSVDESGKTHESLYLSDGYKDMVNFCSRMALVDALFKDVKPPVILDDPFVNLDDDKVPRALKLVKEMSKENQILYFACHKSREVK